MVKMPETRKTAKGKEEPKAEPGAAAAVPPIGMVPGESPEMYAIRLMQTSFVQEQQRAEERRVDAEAKRTVPLPPLEDDPPLPDGFFQVVFFADMNQVLEVSMCGQFRTKWLSE